MKWISVIQHTCLPDTQTHVLIRELRIRRGVVSPQPGEGPCPTRDWAGSAPGDSFRQREDRFSSVAQLCLTLCNPMDCQASLSITNSWSLLKLMSVASVMSFNHLILFILFSSCLQSFPASGSFPVSQQVVKVLELQLQHQFLQYIFRTDFL